MKSRSKTAFAILAAIVGLSAAAPSFAHGRGDDWRDRGRAHGHWKHKHYKPQRPARVYVQPAPVYVQPAPVYVQPAPVYVEPARVYYPRRPQVIVNLPPAIFNF